SIIFVLHDITDLRRLEEERQKLEEQLFQSQKMDAIGQLASGVAHDFNNILTGIQGNASLIMMDYNAEHLHYQRLSRIEENVKRGAKLTKQLLGFARGGKYEIRTLDVNDLVRKNAQLFTETRKEIEADFELQDNVCPVEADAGQIDQVLLNIYINAGHAMPGGGNLHIRTANVTLPEKDAQAFEIPPGDYVRISISDTGTGMDQATLKRIFEPFFTTKAKQGGTGLGLASAYGIIRNHGGAITVQSEPGCGATFIIYLPVSGKEVDGESSSGFGNLVSGSGVILLVDDEPLILDSASEMLKMLGYTVYPAPTGQEALSIYMEKQNLIDLVILDMILPGMNGAQILKMLKDINPGVRVILSSGYSMQGDARNVMDMGCAGFIQKPYSFADLSALVNKTIRPSRKNGN
ncbi:MAG TPA: response regulator, partial [Smithellaceae bacterium]|nr:response regulator [Smithellaceae bacterium]